MPQAAPDSRFSLNVKTYTSSPEECDELIPLSEAQILQGIGHALLRRQLIERGEKFKTKEAELLAATLLSVPLSHPKDAFLSPESFLIAAQTLCPAHADSDRKKLDGPMHDARTRVHSIFPWVLIKQGAGEVTTYRCDLDTFPEIPQEILREGIFIAMAHAQGIPLSRQRPLRLDPGQFQLPSSFSFLGETYPLRKHATGSFAILSPHSACQEESDPPPPPPSSAEASLPSGILWVPAEMLQCAYAYEILTQGGAKPRNLEERSVQLLRFFLNLGEEEWISLKNLYAAFRVILADFTGTDTQLSDNLNSVIRATLEPAFGNKDFLEREGARGSRKKRLRLNPELRNVCQLENPLPAFVHAIRKRFNQVHPDLDLQELDVATVELERFSILGHAICQPPIQLLLEAIQAFSNQQKVHENELRRRDVEGVRALRARRREEKARLKGTSIDHDPPEAMDSSPKLYRLTAEAKILRQGKKEGLLYSDILQEAIFTLVTCTKDDPRYAQLALAFKLNENPLRVLVRLANRGGNIFCVDRAHIEFAPVVPADTRSRREFHANLGISLTLDEVSGGFNHHSTAFTQTRLDRIREFK